MSREVTMSRSDSLSLVGAPGRGVVAADQLQGRLLRVGEGVGVLEQCPPGPLELDRQARVGQAPQLLPDVAADAVHGPVAERDEVVGVGTDRRLRRVVGDRLVERGAEVQRDRFQLLRAFVAEFSEEPVEGLGGLAGTGPHDLRGLGVRHEREVVMLLAPRDLVHADHEQPLETVRIEHVSDHAFADPSDRAPRDPQQLRDRGLVGPGRQPRHQILDIAREPRAGTGEVHALDHDAMGGTAEPSQPRSDLELERTEIKVAPARVDQAGVVAATAPVATVRAHQRRATKRHLDCDGVASDVHLPDVHPIEAQQAVECGRDAHGLISLKVHGFDTAEQPTRRPVRVRSTSAFHHSRAPTPTCDGDPGAQHPHPCQEAPICGTGHLADPPTITVRERRLDARSPRFGRLRGDIRRADAPIAVCSVSREPANRPVRQPARRHGSGTRQEARDRRSTGRPHHRRWSTTIAAS
jgi:hypothetical protein